MKTLYTYTIDKVEKIEKRVAQEDGKILLEYENQVAPIKIAIKKPDRNETDEFQLIYDSEFSKAVVAGVATIDMMRKAYLNAEGLDANIDLENLDVIYRELQKNQLSYQKMIIDGADKETLKDLEDKIESATRTIMEFKGREELFFSRTAESRAKKKTIFWCALNLLFYENESNGAKKYAPVFEGSNFESRKALYYDILEEKEDSIEEKIFEKGYLIIQSWLGATNMTKEDFETLESIINDHLSANGENKS